MLQEQFPQLATSRCRRSASLAWAECFGLCRCLVNLAGRGPGRCEHGGDCAANLAFSCAEPGKRMGCRPVVVELGKQEMLGAHLDTAIPICLATCQGFWQGRVERFLARGRLGRMSPAGDSWP